MSKPKLYYLWSTKLKLLLLLNYKMLSQAFTLNPNKIFVLDTLNESLILCRLLKSHNGRAEKENIFCCFNTYRGKKSCLVFFACISQTSITKTKHDKINI